MNDNINEKSGETRVACILRLLGETVALNRNTKDTISILDYEICGTSSDSLKEASDKTASMGVLGQIYDSVNTLHTEAIESNSLAKKVEAGISR